MWNLHHLLLRLGWERIDRPTIRRWIESGDLDSLALALRHAPHYQLRLFALEQLALRVLPADPRLTRALIHLVRHDLLVVAEPAAELLRRHDTPAADHAAIARALLVYQDRARRDRNFRKAGSERHFVNRETLLIDKSKMQMLAKVKELLKKPISRFG